MGELSLNGSARIGQYYEHHPAGADVGSGFFGGLSWGASVYGGSGRWSGSLGWNDLATGTLGAGGARGHTAVFGAYRDFTVPATPSSWGITDFSRAYGMNTVTAVLFTPQASMFDAANTTWYCAKENTSTYSDLAVPIKAGAAYPFIYLHQSGAGNLFFTGDDKFTAPFSVDLGFSLTSRIGLPTLLMITNTYDDASAAVVDPFSPALVASSGLQSYAVDFLQNPYVTAIAGNRGGAPSLTLRANWAMTAPSMPGEPDSGNAFALTRLFAFP